MGANAVKLSRLVQPGNPLFWVMVVLNGLSSVLIYFLHTHDLPLGPRLLVGGFALGNAVIGMRIAFRLMRDEPEGSANSSVDTGRSGISPD